MKKPKRPTGEYASSRPTNFFDLSGKNIILTGGLGFLGRSYIKDFVASGANVHVIDLIPGSQGVALVKMFNTQKGYGAAFYYRADVTNKNQLESVRKKILADFKSIDVLINNAALNNPNVKKTRSYSSDFENFSLDLWNKEMAVNLTGAMLCCQVFGRVMKHGASIINISSTYGVVGPDQRIYSRGMFKPVSYSVTKGALVALTKYLATYWGKKSIRVNCVVFGGVEADLSKEFIKNYSSRVPLGRMAKSGEYNGILIFLASDRSSYSTGAVYTLDGGWTAW